MANKEDEKIKEKERNKKLLKNIRLYVIPIVAVVGLILIIVFLILPKLTDIFAQMDYVNLGNETIKSNDEQILLLRALSNDYSNLVQKLSIVNQIAPTGTTEVVKFRDKVTQLIVDNHLTIISQRLSEANVDTSTIGNGKPIGNLVLQEVPFLFTVEGKYNDLVTFINSLGRIDDFIIVKEMQLNAVDSTDNTKDDWIFKINMVKYQFNNVADEAGLRKAFLNVPLTAKPSDAMDSYINQRTSNLGTPTTDQTTTQPTNTTP